jgi:hypothetical protein
MEIAAEVADCDRAVIVEQVANGVSIRMAVLYLLLGGSEPAGSPSRGGYVSRQPDDGTALEAAEVAR